MAKSKGGLPSGDFSSKKAEDDVPVAPCQGWVDPCEFCDKRFGNWVNVDEEVLEKVPVKPGIFMLALMNKGVVEVVDIVIDSFDIQKPGYSCIDFLKERIADKKSKATKAVIQCRWMTFKTTDDKDVVNLCAHWFNNGVLPKFLEKWPGLDILEKTKHLIFSEYLQKWCYPKKDAFWRKPKGPPSKLVEAIEGCDWTKPCEICDESFGKWLKVENVVGNSLAPDSAGLYMLSVVYGKTREVVNIAYDENDITLNIQESLKTHHKSLNYVLRNKKYLNRNPHFEVRWLEIKEAESDNCCFFYAHWLNADTIPMMNHKLPGAKIVEKNKNYVLRIHDKKWCYETDVFKQDKGNKNKKKTEANTMASGVTSKDQSNEVPVPPCRGYHCDFCDSRFSDWIDVDEETLEKIPTKPGICILGILNCALDLYGSNVSEIVEIVIDSKDFRKSISKSIDQAKEHIKKKKSRFSVIPYMYVIQCKWVIFESIDDKYVDNVVAHWANQDPDYLPSFLDKWPGLDSLRTNGNFIFSEVLQKWCYPKKEAS